MDKDEFEDNWNKIRSQSKIWWGLITDFDLEQVAKADDKFFEYVSILQLKYGLVRQAAKAEIARHLTEYEAIEKVALETVDPR